MSRSRPITGPAAGDHDRYRENYARIFGPKSSRLGEPRPKCGMCLRDLGRLEVGFCRECLHNHGPLIQSRNG